MDEDKKRRKIKCPGRFPQTRSVLAEALDMLRDSPSFEPVDSVAKLEEVVSLVGEPSLLFDHDYPDTYFNAERDKCRVNPLTGVRSEGLQHLPEGSYGRKLPLSIVPLIAKEARVSPAIGDLYVNECIGASGNVADFLRLFHNLPNGRSLDINMGLDLSKVLVPCREDKEYQNLAGYSLAGEFGVGGKEGDLVISDSPYMVYLIKNPNERRGTPAATSLGIGFWTGGPREMLVSQIQQPRGAALPEDCHIGVVGLTLATKIARMAGFDRVLTYSANTHPMFVQHPDRKQRGDFMEDFSQYFDKSARTLGYSGTRGEFYVLDLRDAKNNNHNGHGGQKIIEVFNKGSGAGKPEH